MEFKDNEKLSKELTGYITKYADGEEIKKISAELGIEYSTTHNLLYRKIKFQKGYEELVIRLTEASVKKGVSYSRRTSKLKKLIKKWKSI